MTSPANSFIEINGLKKPSQPPRVAMIDLDGTVSTIREGWHAMLIKMEVEILRQTPKGRSLTQEELEQTSQGLIEQQIGKQTIFQCRALAETVRLFGGEPEEPETYNSQYLALLDQTVGPRQKAMEAGADPRPHRVPGTRAFLEMLQRHQLKLYLVSGTEDEQVKIDARLLQIDTFFDGGIYGGLPDPTAFSKEKMVDRILKENNLHGEQLLGIGDGMTETLNVKAVGGFTIGVASDETNRNQHVDPWKRDQLLRAGADWIIPDYSDLASIETGLFAG